MTYLFTLEVSFAFSQSIGLSWLLNFIETRCVHLQHLWHWNYLISHAKTSLFDDCTGGSQGVLSLTDQIWAKYEQLDSGEYGAVGTTAFNVEACELANLLACVSQLCQKLNLLTPKELYRPMFFKHWRHFLDQNYTGQAVCLGHGGCSFVPIDM